MEKYHLYDGSTVDFPVTFILLDYDLLSKLINSNWTRRSIGRVMTAVVCWLEGRTSPNLNEKEWYVATLLYKRASGSLSKYQHKQKPKEEELMENMVREARRKRKEKNNCNQ